MDKETGKTILFFIDRMIYARETFNELRENEQERQTSTLLGKKALIYDIILLIFLGGAVALVIWGLSLSTGWQVFMIIVAAIISLAMIPYFILALNFSIKQLRLNKRPIGFVALILPILLIVAVVVVVLISVL